jgi:hypothetical protein
MSDMIIQPVNYTSPSFIYGKNIYTTFSVRAYREYINYLRTIELHTDSGWLMEDISKENYFAMDRQFETWDFSDTSEVFFNYQLRCSTSRQSIQRNYVKIQTIAANVGGMIKFLLLSGEILIYYYRNLDYKEYLTYTFFHSINSELSNKTDKYYKNMTILSNKKNSDSGGASLNENNKIQKSEMGKFNNFVDCGLQNNENEIIESKILNKKQSLNILGIQANQLNEIKKITEGIDKKNKMKFCQVFCSCLHKSNDVEKRIKTINSAYSILDSKFDFLHFIKVQNETEFIKSILFNENQIDLINLSYKNSNESEVQVS